LENKISHLNDCLLSSINKFKKETERYSNFENEISLENYISTDVKKFLGQHQDKRYLGVKRDEKLEKICAELTKSIKQSMVISKVKVKDTHFRKDKTLLLLSSFLFAYKFFTMNTDVLEYFQQVKKNVKVIEKSYSVANDVLKNILVAGNVLNGATKNIKTKLNSVSDVFSGKLSEGKKYYEFTKKVLKMT